MMQSGNWWGRSGSESIHPFIGSLDPVLVTPMIVVSGAFCGVAMLFWLRGGGDPDRVKTTRAFLPVVLATGIFCRLIYVVFTPQFFAPDESPHFKYLQHLVEQRSFPVQMHMYGDASEDWEFCQPPFYYLLMTPILMIAKAVFPNPGMVIEVLRLISVLLWIGNVSLAWLALKRAEITDPYIRGFVVAFLSLLPTYTFISATINNDNLLAVIGTALICVMAGRGFSLGRAVVMGLLLGLALLTKQSAALFVPAVVALIGLKALKNQIHWRAGLLYLGISLGMAFILYSPWALRNWHRYHSFTPEQVWVTTRTWPSPLYGLASALHNLAKSFWAVSGKTNQFGYPFPLVGYAFLLLCLILPRKKVGNSSAELEAAVNETQDPTNPMVVVGTSDFLNLAINGPFLGACLIAVLVNLVLVVQFGYRLGMGQGRHLFPVLLPIALVFAARWRRFPFKNVEPWTSALWIVYALSFQAYSLWRFTDGIK